MKRHGYCRPGGKHHWLYGRWNAMKQRCFNPNQAHYERYGGRGIKVCEAWLDFANFLADMGEPPDRSYTLERDDNNKGYEPGNVRWATRSEQRANSRTGTVGSRHGRSKLTERDVEIIRSSPLNCAQLGRAFGVVPSVISGIRLRRSWRHVP